MFFKKTEIEKVIKQYGDSKGTAFLTIYNTYMRTIMPLMTAGRNDEAANRTNLFVQTLKQKYGMPFVLEYDPFFRNNMQNMKLQRELEQAGEKYIDKSLIQ